MIKIKTTMFTLQTVNLLFYRHDEGVCIIKVYFIYTIRSICKYIIQSAINNQFARIRKSYLIFIRKFLNNLEFLL